MIPVSTATWLCADSKEHHAQTLWVQQPVIFYVIKTIPNWRQHRLKRELQGSDSRNDQAGSSLFFFFFQKAAIFSERFAIPVVTYERLDF